MPNVVKGSKQKQMVVVAHRPVMPYLYMAALLLVSLACGWGGFYYGRQLYGVNLANEAVNVELTQNMQRLEAENAQLQRDIIRLEFASTIDQQANQEVRSTLLNLQEQIAGLEQNIALYKEALESND